MLALSLYCSHIRYCTNVVENPAEPKFRRIKKENKAFVARVKSCGERGINFLSCVPGFPLFYEY